MRKIIIISLVLFLCGCGATKLKSVGKKPDLDLHTIEPLSLDEVKFVVVNRENVQQVFDELEKKGQVPVIIGMTGTDYKNLSVNMKKIQNYLREQQKTIILYKDYYENK